MFSQRAASIALHLRRQAPLSVTQPLSKPVNANNNSYLALTGHHKLGWRRVHRAMYLRLSGREKYCHARISHKWKRGLWLYKGIPQIDDALMALPSRCMLAEQGLAMDLNTDPHLATIFDGDPRFNRVLSDPQTFRPEDYDFVIVPSFKRRLLKQKISLLRKLPSISMRGFYTGPEFHRGEFDAQRLADALGLKPSSPVLLEHARQKLKPLPLTLTTPRSHLQMAIVLDGADPLRSHQNWRALANRLDKSHLPEVTLLGSANELDVGRAFKRHWNGPLHNWVNQTDLAQCRQLMSDQRIVLAFDGGLMHLAATTPVPLISLFTLTVEPVWRFPGDGPAWALQLASNDVNAIDPDEIARLVRQTIAIA